MLADVAQDIDVVEGVQPVGIVRHDGAGEAVAEGEEFREGGAVYLNEAGRKTVLFAYQERKKETLQHPVLEQAVEIGLLPLLQARLLARYLRGDVASYIPFLNK